MSSSSYLQSHGMLCMPVNEWIMLHDAMQWALEHITPDYANMRMVIDTSQACLSMPDDFSDEDVCSFRFAGWQVQVMTMVRGWFESRRPVVLHSMAWADVQRVLVVRDYVSRCLDDYQVERYLNR